VVGVIASVPLSHVRISPCRPGELALARHRAVRRKRRVRGWVDDGSDRGGARAVVVSRGAVSVVWPRHQRRTGRVLAPGRQPVGRCDESGRAWRPASRAAGAASGT
jgi:hypothetical protein